MPVYNPPTDLTDIEDRVSTLEGTPPGAAAWGDIGGTLADQTDLDTELDLKAPLANPTFTGTVAGVSKSMVGLGNVDNTSDASKPVSTATQTALDGKQTLDADLTTIAGLTATTDSFMQAKASAWAARTVAQVKTDLGLTGTNSGDQTSIVGITGTKAQFDTAVTDGNISYVGDAPTSHGNEAHTSTFITSTGVTFGNLSTNSGTANITAFATATTSISAATYADITGCSVTPAAGTWLLIGQVNIGIANGIIQAFVAITDGSNTVISEVAASRPASGTASLSSPFSCAVHAIVTANGSTTYKLRGARGLTTHTGSWTAMDGNGVNTTNHLTNNTDKGTGIFAIRIA